MFIAIKIAEIELEIVESEGPNENLKKMRKIMLQALKAQQYTFDSPSIGKGLGLPNFVSCFYMCNDINNYEEKIHFTTYSTV